MWLIDKINRKRVERKTGYTLFDDVFIPMFVGTEAEMRGVYNGNMVLKPSGDEAVFRELLSNIPKCYIGMDERAAVRSGGFANFAELLAKQIPMYPLSYVGGTYKRLDRRFKKIGDWAVIIMYPDVFFRRFQNAVEKNLPNLYYGMYASACYRGISTDPYKYSFFSRNQDECWKKEIILAIRMNPSLKVTETHLEKLLESVYLNLGNLSDIAVMCPMRDLLECRYPENLLTSYYTRYLNSFKVSPREVKQWTLSVAANVMSITPTTDWIEKLLDEFPKDKWEPVAQVEKLYQDGEGMPRLAFFDKLGWDRVFIHINRIELHFFDYKDEQKTMTSKLLHFVEKECRTRFCHMTLETHADLGAVRNTRILSQTSFREERTCQRGELFEYQFLEADYKMTPSIMGVDMARKNWHYAVRLSTPDDEHTMWYDADTVMDFFEKSAKSNLSRIGYLMKGDAYGKYREIR